MRSQTYWSRRLLRHSALAAITVVLLGGVYAGVPTDFILRRWNLATAYVGLGLMALSLLIGPWNLLRGRANPVSQDVRRDVGIWAALLGVAHTLIGLQIHMIGQSRLVYFFFPAGEAHRLPIRSDGFGFANYTGLGSTLILLLLLALSNDVALRRLGTGRWKSLQRWNYAGFALMTLHAIAYQVIGKRVVPVIVVFAGVIVVVLATQLAGRARHAAPGPRD